MRCWPRANSCGCAQGRRRFFESLRRRSRGVRSRGGRFMDKDMGQGKPVAAGKARAARRIVIAIDGPAGSGKSTLAAWLARRYGYANIESGAMYRALALKAILQDVSVNDGEALGALARQSRIELQPRPEGNQELLGGEDVTERRRLQDL